MKSLQVNISESDYKKYNFTKGQEIKFPDLVEKINLEYARNALIECNEIAKKTGLSEITLDELNKEINAARNAKNNS